jgi:hypothetical protein
VARPVSASLPAIKSRQVLTALTDNPSLTLAISEVDPNKTELKVTCQIAGVIRRVVKASFVDSTNIILESDADGALVQVEVIEYTTAFVTRGASSSTITSKNIYVDPAAINPEFNVQNTHCAWDMYTEINSDQDAYLQSADSFVMSGFHAVAFTAEEIPANYSILDVRELMK